MVTVNFDFWEEYEDPEQGQYDCVETRNVVPVFDAPNIPSGCNGCEFTWAAEMNTSTTNCGDWHSTIQDQVYFGLNSFSNEMYLFEQGNWNFFCEGVTTGARFQCQTGFQSWLKGVDVQFIMDVTWF